MAKQILRVETIKSVNSMTGKWRHNYRLGKVLNADPDRKDLNHQLIPLPAGYNYGSFYRKRLEELPYYETHEPRKNGVMGFELMLSFGNRNPPEEYRKNPEEWLRKWEEQNRKFLIDEFGKENIASAVVHMDEGTPHIHAVVIPVKDGKISARKFIENREALRDMHTRYHDYMKECGLEAENRYVRLEHEKIGAFYGQIGKALESSLPKPEENETLDDYAERAGRFYQEQSLRAFSKDNEIKKLSEKNKALEDANKLIAEKTRDELTANFNAMISKEIVSLDYAKKAIAYMESMETMLDEVAIHNPMVKQSYDKIMNIVYESYEQILADRDREAKTDR